MSAAQNALCLNCGCQNFAPSFGKGTCTQCRSELRHGTLQKNLPSTFGPPLSLKAWLAIGAGVIVLLWWVNSSNNNSTYSNQSYVAPYEETQSYPPAAPPASYDTPAPTFDQPPVSITTGEVRFTGSGERVAPLEIVTTPGANYFVKLVNSATGVAEEFVFVHGGDRFQVLMPLGTYELKYASGDTWYGESFLFGPDTSYTRADAPFEFTYDGLQYQGYTVELYRRPGGNLDVDQISATQF